MYCILVAHISEPQGQKGNYVMFDVKKRNEYDAPF